MFSHHTHDDIGKDIVLLLFIIWQIIVNIVRECIAEVISEGAVR